ncbi:NfeD family protein [Methylobacillus sp.]|jgi:membrane protein implicated in regulation of membrane protease activity|uniref:NfeD family protein n=1 Tax=Betaproteobacteria TaxID=28216 RepID=UPI002FE29468
MTFFANLPADYWWMLAAGGLALIDQFIPRKGLRWVAVAAALTSGLVLVGLVISIEIQALIFVIFTVAFGACRYLKQVFSGKPQVQSYANILAVNDDGSLTAEFEKEPWPAVVLEGEVQPGDRVGVTAVSNGVLWCTKA